MATSREIILDTETTGIDPKQGHRIIEIGAIEIIDKRMTGKVFHVYINPQRDVTPQAYRVHGISRDFLKKAKGFREYPTTWTRCVNDSTSTRQPERFTELRPTASQSVQENDGRTQNSGG
ncbi:hypothetical protein JTE90_026873 [Oedothorax gibbosus]|uniref:Exonuclease domain-containing protein n=1 Tax=Oedothorax gibbosus TaxID=931172 RepID=A0AAV6TSZ0_9ARAC|nr:hypothetical protein JTE90_026873 [Oedothorax gibbosus]